MAAVGSCWDMAALPANASGLCCRVGAPFVATTPHLPALRDCHASKHAANLAPRPAPCPRHRAVLRFVRDVVIPTQGLDGGPCIGFNVGRATDPKLGPLLIAMVSGTLRHGRPGWRWCAVCVRCHVAAAIMPGVWQQCVKFANNCTHCTATCVAAWPCQVVVTGGGSREEKAELLRPLRELGPIQARVEHREPTGMNRTGLCRKLHVCRHVCAALH